MWVCLRHHPFQRTDRVQPPHPQLQVLGRVVAVAVAMLLIELWMEPTFLMTSL
jgi:hypothetical protein